MLVELLVMVMVVHPIEGNAESRTFRAVSIDGQVTEYTYPWKQESECIFNGRLNYAICMDNYSFTDVTSVWTKTPDELKYVSINCLTLGRYAEGQCACANSKENRTNQCQLETLEDGTFSSLINLEVLDLSNNKIESISARALHGLSKLKYLSLSGNSMKTLPMSLFCPISNIVILSLRDNSLVTYPNDAFRCKRNFTELSILELTGSTFISVSEHAFDLLPNVISVDLSNNSLNGVTKSSLAGAKSLQFLDLSQNQLSELFSHFCDYFSNLSYIILHDNKLTSFNFEILQQCSYLSYFDVSKNSIKEMVGNLSNFNHLEVFNISDNALTSLELSVDESTSMKWLNLSFNELTEVPVAIIANLTELSFLDLSSNSISSTENFQGISDGFSKVIFFDLSSNKISHVPNNTFSNMDMLQELILSNNAINQLHPLSFGGLGSLNRLLLDTNRLNELPNDLFLSFNSATPLKQLFLSNNSFTDLSEISKWPLVEELDISENQLTSVPSAIDYSGMRVFNASNNKVNVFFGMNENLLADFESLESFDISSNNISDIRLDIFKNLKNLKILDAAQNKIKFTFTSDVFQGANLTHVNFASNAVEKIGEIFTENSLPNLISLDLSSNPILSVGRLATNFYDSLIENIDLSNCNISSVQAESFFGMNNLKTAYLNGNKMKTFPIMHAQNFTMFDFRENPLLCDCTMEWLRNPTVEFVHENVNTSVSTDRYLVSECEIVGGGRYYPDQLTSEQFLCTQSQNCDSSCSCYKTSQDGDIFLMKCQNNLHVVPNNMPVSANTIFLDGNSFSTNKSLLPLASLYKMSAKELYLNRSFIRHIGNDVLLPFERLEYLDLSHNLIKTLTAGVFEAQTVLRQLLLNDNNLETIEPNVFNSFEIIKEINLSGNKLIIISPETATELSNLDYIPMFYFSRNPWNCGCSNIQFKTLFDEVSSKIGDKSEITCDSGEGQGKQMINVPKSFFLCDEGENVPKSNKTLIIILIAVICVSLLLFATCVYFRRELLSLLYYKTGCHIPGKKRFPRVHFDAYVVYDPSDQHCSNYVQNTIIPKLKNNSFSFQTSSDVIQDIEVTRKVIEDSRCSIFIVDKNFSANDFLLRVFLGANEWRKREKRHKVIMIVHGDIDLVVLEPEIVSRMRKGDYITARSRLWWERLAYELPEPSSGIRHNHGYDDDDDVVVFSSLAQNQGQYEQF
ncbi:TIR domain [Mactra antiquata]